MRSLHYQFARRMAQPSGLAIKVCFDMKLKSRSYFGNTPSQSQHQSADMFYFFPTKQSTVIPFHMPPRNPLAFVVHSSLDESSNRAHPSLSPSSAPQSTLSSGQQTPLSPQQAMSVHEVHLSSAHSAPQQSFALWQASKQSTVIPSHTPRNSLAFLVPSSLDESSIRAHPSLSPSSAQQSTLSSGQQTSLSPQQAPSPSSSAQSPNTHSAAQQSLALWHPPSPSSSAQSSYTHSAPQSTSCHNQGAFSQQCLQHSSSAHSAGQSSFQTDVLTQFYTHVAFDIELFVYNHCVDELSRNNTWKNESFVPYIQVFELYQGPDFIRNITLNRVVTSGHENSCSLASIIQSSSAHFRCSTSETQASVVRAFKDLLIKIPLGIPEVFLRDLCQNVNVDDELMTSLACFFKTFIIQFSIQGPYNEGERAAYKTMGFGVTNGGKVCSYMVHKPLYEENSYMVHKPQYEEVFILIPRRVIFIYFANFHFESVRLFDHFVITPQVYEALPNENKLIFNDILRCAELSAESAGRKCDDFVDRLRNAWNLRVP